MRTPALSLLLALCAAAAMAQTPAPAPASPSPSNSGDAVEQWHNFGPAAFDPEVPAGRAALVILRGTAQQEKPRAISIALNGDFHTALLAGAYKKALLCPGLVRIDAAAAILQKPELASATSTSGKLRLHERTTRYLLAEADPAGRVSLRILSEADARAILANAQEQDNAISRVRLPPNCPAETDDAPADAQAPAPR